MIHERVSVVVRRLGDLPGTSDAVEWLKSGAIAFICSECKQSTADPFVAMTTAWRIIFYCPSCNRDTPTTMNNRDNPALYQARKLAAALRVAKSDHPWTEQELGLFSNLCAELGVDAEEHASTVADGEALAKRWPQKKEEPPLVHEAKAGGRHVHLTTYLEGGTLPIKATLLFWCHEDATECARVLTEARTKRPKDPRWGK